VVPVFEALLPSRYRPLTLVTRPPKPVHGKRREPSNPAFEVAQSHGLPVLMPEDVNSEPSRRQLGALRPDLLVVCDFGQILSAKVLQLSRLGGINLHGSLLPKYRGAAPVNWALYNGDVETGVSVIHITPALDAGPCLSLQRTDIEPDETAVELESRLAQLGVEPVLDALAMLEAWDGQSAIGLAQDRSQVSKAPRLKKTDGQVDWSRTAVQIRNQVRAMQPWPGTYTQWQRPGGSAVRIILQEVALVEEPTGPGPPGAVQSTSDGQFIVSTGDGGLRLCRVQPAGKRAMSADEFLRGHRLNAGDRLG
jgi:methionyl-tRNA formyltransferase